MPSIRLLIILLLAGPCLAQPTITMVDGNFHPDGILVILGSGFGDKDPAAPLLIDRLTDVPAYLDRGLTDGDTIPTQADGCPDCPWWSVAFQDVAVRYSTDDPRYPGGAAYRATGRGSLALMDLGASIPDRLVVNWWARTSHDLEPLAGAKLIRVWANDDGAEGTVTWSPTYLRCTADQDHDGMPESDSMNYSSWTGQPDTWVNLELRIDSRDQVDLGYGLVEARVNGMVIHQLECWAREPLNMVRALGLNLPDSDPAMDPVFDWTDIYIDTTLARVLISDAPTLDSATRIELQIPDEWQSDRIRIATRLGSFEVGEEVYLFVVDAEGQASSGSLVAIGDDDSPGVPGVPSVWFE